MSTTNDVTQQALWVSSLIDGFKSGLAPSREMQHYQNVQDQEQLRRVLIHSYIYGSKPDYKLDNIARITDEDKREMTLFHAYRYGMAFDYDRDEIGKLTEHNRADLLRNLFVKGIKPDYHRHGIDRFVDPVYKAATLKTAYFNGLVPDFEGHCIAAITPEAARVRTLVSAYHNGLKPDRHKHGISKTKCPKNRIVLLAYAYKNGMAPDFEADVGAADGIANLKTGDWVQEMYKHGLPPSIRHADLLDRDAERASVLDVVYQTGTLADRGHLRPNMVHANRVVKRFGRAQKARRDLALYRQFVLDRLPLCSDVVELIAGKVDK
jgi:hypothetical protein